MSRFIPHNYQQNSMVVINYLDQLQAGTFEYAKRHQDKKTRKKTVIAASEFSVDPVTQPLCVHQVKPSVLEAYAKTTKA